MLVKDRYELPGFNSLNRLVCRLRTRVNHQLFSQVIQQLDEKYLNYLDSLLKNHPVHQRSSYNDLKKLPKKSTRNHLNDLLVHLTWLESLGDIAPYLQKINPSKIQHWAARDADASPVVEDDDLRECAALNLWMRRKSRKLLNQNEPLYYSA